MSHDQIPQDYIPPTSIIVPESRQRGNLGDMSGLQRSISQRGILVPLIVTVDQSDELPRDESTEYTLIAGERRLTCALELGLTSVPVRFWTRLSPEEQVIIELEENAVRKNLSWREHVQAVYRAHEALSAGQPKWTDSQTAERIGLDRSNLSQALRVYPHLDSPSLADCSSLIAADNVVKRRREREVQKAVSIIDDDISQALTPMPSGPTPASEEDKGGSASASSSPPSSEADQGVETEVVESPSSQPPVLCQDFIPWSENYSGPRFNFIHCDFPYGINHDKSAQGGATAWGSYSDSEDIYWGLIEAFLTNLDRFASKSCHVMFWFSMDKYSETIRQFEETGFTVLTRPLIWHKSDNAGIAPDVRRQPRQTYETALMMSRGDRKIVKVKSNSYSAPSAKKDHQSEKPEAVLKHFFQMFVDDLADVLDPTCGSGSALRAAAALDASRVQGLELNPEYAEHALLRFEAAEKLRRANKELEA